MEIGINAATRLLENKIKQEINKSGMPITNVSYALENVLREVKTETEKQIEKEIEECKRNKGVQKKVLRTESKESEEPEEKKQL